MLLSKNRKKLFVLVVVLFGVFLFDECIEQRSTVLDFRGEAYAGSEKCQNCHKEICSSYSKTAHFNTSGEANEENILGSFQRDSNSVQYRPSVKVVMQKTDSGFYQVAYLDNSPKQSARFDMIIGSGMKGQSYLSFLGTNVYQLPVSHFTPSNQWINSPGYPPKFVLFNRNIPLGCFQCHSSYIRKLGSEISNGYVIDHFDKKQVIYGIDCERCHGPLEQHVNYQENHPDNKTAKFVTKISALLRNQKLSMCAACHSGANEPIQSSFYYKPGAKVPGAFERTKNELPPKDIDVHGKQFQLLSASKCFIKSTGLSCTTCHNPHNDEKGKLISFSAKCISCHPSVNHQTTEAINEVSKKNGVNCIDCHMPQQPSRVITMKSSSQSDSISAYVRTHFISIYKTKNLVVQ